MLCLTKPNLRFGNNNKGINQLICMSIKQFFNRVNLWRGTLILKAKEYNTVMRLVFTVNLFAENFVVCDQDPVFGVCLVENGIICRTPCLFVDGKDFLGPLRMYSTVSRVPLITGLPTMTFESHAIRSRSC